MSDAENIIPPDKVAGGLPGYKDAVHVVCLAGITLAVLIQNNQLIVNMMLIIATVFLFGVTFANNRNESIDAKAHLVTALVLTLLLPIDLTWWQVILFTAFGVVLGEQIFGGRGFSFVSPVICGLAFYHFSYEPALHIPVNNLPVIWLGGAALLLLGVKSIDWRVAIALLISLVAVSGLFSADLSLPSTSVALCILYAGLDMAIQPKNPSGRWVYGFLFGLLLFLLNPGLESLDKAVSACLLASILVPLIDSIAQALKSMRESRPGDQRVTR